MYDHCNCKLVCIKVAQITLVCSLSRTHNLVIAYGSADDVLSTLDRTHEWCENLLQRLRLKCLAHAPPSAHCSSARAKP